MRSLDYLQALRRFLTDEITNNTSPEDGTKSVLDDHVHDFRKVFDDPRASAESRRKVESTKLILDNQECEINKEFMDETIRLSDLLELDEVICAELLYEGTQQSVRYDRTPFECALYLYHAKRQILLDSVRLLFDLAIEDTLQTAWRTELSTFLHLIMADRPSSFASSCITNMELCVKRLEKMDKHHKRDLLLGSVTESADAGSLRTSLVQEHQTLALILCVICRICPDTSSFVTKLLESLKTKDSWTDLVSHQLLIVMRSAQAMVAVDEAHTSDITVADVGKLFREWSSMTDEKEHWACLPLQSVLQLLLATELNGLCKENDEVSAIFDYGKDILEPVRCSVNHRAFQHLITYILFVTCEIELENPFKIFFENDALKHFTAPTEGTEQSLLIASLKESIRLFIQSFILNMADELKEMRLAQEDAVLAAELDSDAQVDVPSHDVELFFGLIYTVYDDRPEQVQEFWDDKESDLYGFIAWASQSQSPSTVYSFFTMLSVLSKGPHGSLAALEFLDSPNPQQDKSHLRPALSVTWPFIFDSLRYYVRSLDRSQAAKYQEPLEIDANSNLVLKSYFYQISNTIESIPQIDTILDVQKRHECLALFFQLLGCRLAPDLYVQILQTISAFARSHDLQLRIWPLLEQWLAGIDLSSHSFILSSSGARQKQMVHRPLTCLQTFSYNSVELQVAIVRFLTSITKDSPQLHGSLPFPENLGESSRHAGIGDYVDFVIEIFASHQVDDQIPVLQRLHSAETCMKFFLQAVEALDLDMVSLARIDPSRVVQSVRTSTFLLYLTLHPGSKTLQRFTKTMRQLPLLNILKSHNVADIAIRNRLSDGMSTTLKFIRLSVLAWPLFSEFVLPLLPTDSAHGLASLETTLSDDVNVMVQIVLLCTSSDPQLELQAIELFSVLLEKSSEQSRIRLLAALVSVDQSKAILLGLITIIDREDGMQSPNSRTMILDLILDDLRKSRSCGSVAHFLLGFAIKSPQELACGTDSGEIGSGTSLLHSLLSKLYSEEPDVLESLQGSHGETLILKSRILQILAILADSHLTSATVLDILRQNEFFESAILSEPVVLDLIYASLGSESGYKLKLLFLKRDALMNIYAKNLLDLNARQAHSELHQCLQVLLSSRPNNAESISHRSSSVLVDVLDILKTDLSISIPDRKWRYYEPASFNSLLDTTMAETSPNILDLALDLKFEQIPSTNDPSTVELRATAEQERNQLRSQLHGTIEAEDTRLALSNCLQRWTFLSVITLDLLKSTNSVPAEWLCADFLQQLFSRLPLYQDTDSGLADILTEAISLILARSNPRRKLDEVHAQSYGKSLEAIQSPASTHIQREMLYMTCATYLDALLSSEGVDRAIQGASASSKIGSERLLHIITQDATLSSGVLKISACVIFDLLTRLSESAKSHWLHSTILRLNFVKRMADHFSYMLEHFEDDLQEEFDRFLDCILRICMNRDCVVEVMSRTKVLSDLMHWKALNLDDHREERTVKRLTVAMQLLTTCILLSNPATAPRARFLTQVIDLYRETWRPRIERYTKANESLLAGTASGSKAKVVLDLYLTSDILEDLISTVAN